MVWVPLLSIALYVLAWVARSALWLPPVRRMVTSRQGGMPLDVNIAGAFLTGLVWVVLCSGSYLLFDVRIPEERLRVTVRII